MQGMNYSKVLVEDVDRYILRLSDQLYEKYSFIGITKEAFLELIKTQILQIISEDQWRHDISFIRNKLVQYLKVMVRGLLKDDIWSLNMINRYIRGHICFMETWQENVKQLKRLSFIFQEFCYEPTSELCQSVIVSNAVIHKMLENIVESNLGILKKYGLNVITNDHTIIRLIKEYCEHYGIDVEKNDDCTDKSRSQSKNMPIMDSVKMYLNEISNPQYNFANNLQLLICAKNGEEDAKKQLIENNLRLVVSIAKEYIGNGVPFLDLVQEGNLALMKAIDRFDLSKGNNFSTYATWWIRRSVATIVAEQGNNFKIPTTMYDSLHKLRRIKQLLKQQFNYIPTIAELANILNVSETKIIQLEKYQQQVNIVSLSSPVEQRENTELEFFIMDSSDLIGDSITQFDLRIAVTQLIDRCDNLLENERTLLIMQFGLYGSKVLSQAEIGRKLGVTRARANAISKNALKKLRCSEDILKGGYSQFMDDPKRAEDNIIQYRKEYMSERTYQRRYGSS